MANDYLFKEVLIQGFIQIFRECPCVLEMGMEYLGEVVKFGNLA